MKNTHFNLALVAATALVVIGCKKETASAPSSAEIDRAAQQAHRDIDKATDQAKKDVDKTKEYLREKREDFYGATDKRLAELDRKLDEYERKARDYKDDAKTEADRAVKSLRDERNRLKEKYGEVKLDTSDA